MADGLKIRRGKTAHHPSFLGMLNDPEREVKKQGIESLGNLKDQRAFASLQEIISNRADRELHALANQALENLAKVSISAVVFALTQFHKNDAKEQVLFVHHFPPANKN